MTALKKMLPELLNESFRQILESFEDMVLVKGPKSKLLWANQAFREFYGMTVEELHGLIDAPFSDPDHTQQYVEHDAYVFESGQVLDIQSEPVTRHDGVVRLFHTVKSPIFDKAGKVVMTVGISRDITDRVETEQNKEEQRVRLAYASRLAMLSEMAGGMAHEINTPLSVILTLTDQIREMVEENEIDRDVFVSSAKVIEEATMKIAKLIAGLRTFAKEQVKEKFEVVEVRAVVNSTLSLCRERIISRGVKLDVLVPERPVKISCSATQVSQVLLNLCLNAQDAVVKSPQRWIRLEVSEREHQVEIAVSDSGGGVPLEIREKIFQPFFTTKEVGDGAGLGLAVSRSMMQSHGGTLELDEASTTTRFKIILPKAA